MKDFAICLSDWEPWNAFNSSDLALVGGKDISLILFTFAIPQFSIDLMSVSAGKQQGLWDPG